MEKNLIIFKAIIFLFGIWIIALFLTYEYFKFLAKILKYSEILLKKIKNIN